MASTIKNTLINGINPVTVGGTGITIKYFPAAPGASIGVASLKNGILFVPDNGEANGQRITIKAGGNYLIGVDAPSASPSCTIGLYPVTFANATAVANSNPASTLASTAVIGATAIVSQTQTLNIVGAAPWALQVDLLGDSTSGLVQLCSGSIVMDGTAGTVTAGLVSGLSGINFSSVAPYGLVVGVTFSVSDAQASANMYQFYLEL